MKTGGSRDAGEDGTEDEEDTGRETKRKHEEDANIIKAVKMEKTQRSRGQIEQL